MPVNMSRGMLKRMEERNIRWEEIDETVGLPQNENLDAEKRSGLSRDTERGLRAAYHHGGRS